MLFNYGSDLQLIYKCHIERKNVIFKCYLVID